MNNFFISFPDTTLHGIFDYYTDLPGHLSKKIANLFYILGSGEVKICSWEVIYWCKNVQEYTTRIRQ